MEEKKGLQEKNDQEMKKDQEIKNDQEESYDPVGQGIEVKMLDEGSLINKPTKLPKKKHGCLIAFLCFFVIIAAVTAGLYFFMPGLRKPNDLGVKASQDAYDSAIRKLTAKAGSVAPSITKETTEIVSEEYSSTYKATEVNAALTSEEVTSLLTLNRPEDYPLQDTQIRLNEDDTMEVSSNVSVDFLLEDILDNEITKEEIAQAVPVLKDLPDNVNVYLKLNADVENNEVEDFDIENISVMGVKLPDSMIGTEDSGAFITESINVYLENKTLETGERYDVLQVEDGNLIIEGAINLP